MGPLPAEALETELSKGGVDPARARDSLKTLKWHLRDSQGDREADWRVITGRKRREGTRKAGGVLLVSGAALLASASALYLSR